jgi:hypothetical protein
VKQYFTNIRDAMRIYGFVHTVTSRTAGLGGFAFFCLCFWLIYQRADPTAISLALLGICGFIVVYLNGGEPLARTFAHRNETTYQQTTTTATSTPLPVGDPVIVNPASLDEEDVK